MPNQVETTLALHALSPLDGRYQNQITELQSLCSEFALMRLRVLVEIQWLQTVIRAVGKSLSKDAVQYLATIEKNFNDADAAHIKEIENKINHDVKSVEYFLREKIQTHQELNQYAELIHFALTSDDTNNLAYGIMLKNIREQVLLPAMQNILTASQQLATQYAAIPMLARTHGQPATPTTVGKEFANFAARLNAQYESIKQIKINGKCNGTVGNFNAHVIAYPDLAWQTISKNFVAELGLNYAALTTQIEPHDYIAELCDAIARFNTILIGLNRDLWGYIALNYFTQKSIAHEVGSSIMPHKINPIDFENSEGNLGIANALLQHFSSKLPISRWQRDLSDSTVMRNIGVSFAHALLAYKSLTKGLQKLEVNRTQLETELNQHWEVLAEAIQTVMRAHGIKNAYEQIKELTRGKVVTAKTLTDFINKLELPTDTKKRLLQLTPMTYVGMAEKTVKEITNRKEITNYE
jgi:adenylosuccinate lyase